MGVKEYAAEAAAGVFITGPLWLPPCKGRQAPKPRAQYLVRPPARITPRCRCDACRRLSEWSARI
ncbi:Uncharacterised protein [Mycobacteroides abscessus subsp. abscessus]|nr:Uncharacterised protein [Mycobacteroides abscessus subsp. abscessus]